MNNRFLRFNGVFLLLGRFDSYFSLGYQQRSIHLYLQKKISASLQEAILEFIRSPKSARQIGVVGLDERLFLKATPIVNWMAKLRVSFSLSRGEKGYDYALADLINSLDIQKSTIATPRIVGYAYKRKYGLVSELSIIYEYLDGHVDGAHWLKKNPERVLELIQQVHLLMDAMHQQRRYHLDLWLGNIMLPEHALRDIKVIDFEHYIAGEPKVPEAMLGFLVGYFYAITLNEYITEADYDAQTYSDVFKCYQHSSLFASGYNLGKANVLSRRARRLLFKGL